MRSEAAEAAERPSGGAGASQASKANRRTPQKACQGYENETFCDRGERFCEEVCSDDAEMLGEDFEQSCTADCKAGRTVCLNDNQNCGEFTNTCAQNCPTSDQALDAGASCQQACGRGRQKCEEKQNLNYN